MDAAIDTTPESGGWPSWYPPLTGRTDNLKWRATESRRAWTDRGYAAAVVEQSARDVRYWWTGWCWLYEPREGGDGVTVLPFVPYDVQLEALAEVNSAIDDGVDLAIPKSRDMGVTWLVLLALQHRWRFRDGFSALLASRKDDLVDTRGDPDSLFEKLRFNLRRQPQFMLPRGFDWGRHDKSKLLINPSNGSTITGESTTGDVGRGARKNCVFVDEAAAISPAEQEKIDASTADTSPCRIWGSTPRGDTNTFHRKCHSDSTRRFDVHWSRHPTKSEQLYQEIEFTGGRVVPGRLRSPWYDREIIRRDWPGWMVAQELDISFSGSTATIFDANVLIAWKQSKPAAIAARWPEHRRDGESALYIYEEPVKGEQYIVACDPAGSEPVSGSHVGIHVIKVSTMEQVAEYQARVGFEVVPSVLYALGKEYNWAMVAVESNVGGGIALDLSLGFVDHPGLVVGAGQHCPPYPAHRIATHVKPDGTATEKLGINTNAQTRPFMLRSILEPAVRNQTTLIRGGRTLTEFGGFRQVGQKIRNPEGDDLVMSYAVGLYCHKFMHLMGSGAGLPFVVG